MSALYTIMHNKKIKLPWSSLIYKQCDAMHKQQKISDTS